MADEGLPGTAQSAPPVTPLTAPAEPQAPQAPPQQPQTPTGGGKSAEQLAAELQEASDLIRETQDRLARMEHERELERQVRTNLTAGRVEEQTPELDYDKLDGEFLTSPAKAMSKILDARLAKEKQERDRERAATYITSARTSFESGHAEATKANPGLFKGIDGDISREILGNVQAGLQAGQPVDVEILRNPKYWEAAAVAYRIMNGEDVSKYFGGTRTPMTPQYAETPTAGNPPQAATLTPEQEELIAKGHITREQFLESLGKVRATSAERSR